MVRKYQAKQQMCSGKDVYFSHWFWLVKSKKSNGTFLGICLFLVVFIPSELPLTMQHNSPSSCSAAPSSDKKLPAAVSQTAVESEGRSFYHFLHIVAQEPFPFHTADLGLRCDEMH